MKRDLVSRFQVTSTSICFKINLFDKIFVQKLLHLEILIKYIHKVGRFNSILHIHKIHLTHEIKSTKHEGIRFVFTNKTNQIKPISRITINITVIDTVIHDIWCRSNYKLNYKLSVDIIFYD